MNQLDNIGKYFRRIFGVRIVKTALATSISLWIASFFDLKMPSMVALSAITTMTSSIFESYQDSINRFYSTIVGVVVGIVFHALGITGYVGIALSMIVVINLCNYFGWQSATKLALMVVVMVMIHNPSPPDYLSYWEYALNRLLDTVIGLGVGFVINYLVLPPDRMAFIINSYKKTLFELEDALLKFLQAEYVDLDPLISDINDLSIELGYAKKEYKLGRQIDIKASELAKLNSLFYSVFGQMIQFVEDEEIPTLTKSNIKALEAYFKQNFEISFNKVDDEFKEAFNYYFEDLLAKMTEIKDKIDHLEEIYEENA